MAVRRKVGLKAKGKRSSDSLSTTPTQYGDVSPDYVAQSGDPDYLRTFSEEQIGMMGGRTEIARRVASKQDTSNFSDPFSKAADQASTISTETPAPSEGPTTPPTTYGIGEMPKPGKQGGDSLTGKPALTGTANALTRGKGKKKGLYKRLAKTTGTTVGEGQGIMKKARKQVRRGNTAGARRTISKALSGGPRAGVSRNPQRTAKAQVAAKKITKRIATRQQQAAPRRRKK